MKSVLIKFFISIFFINWSTPSLSLATAQKSLGFEIGVGYPDLTVSTAAQNARYSGVTAQANLLFPILSSGSFSMDLDLLYKYTATENNASNMALSEWAHFTSFGSGLRLNYSYVFVGFDYLFARGKHIESGSANYIFDYKFNPAQWHVGLALPLSAITSVVFDYSQMLPQKIDVQGTSLNLQEQIFSLRIQIDFGVSFFNLLAPSESFAPTRNGFFSN